MNDFELEYLKQIMIEKRIKELQAEKERLEAELEAEKFGEPKKQLIEKMGRYFSRE